jgi:hypothetical protein
LHILRAVAFSRLGDLSSARTYIKLAKEVLVSQRGLHHPFTLSALAYDTLLNPSEERIKIAERIEKELGWQAGAHELALLVRRDAIQTGVVPQIPVVL